MFGDFADPESKVSKLKEREEEDDGRAYRLLENYGTNPNVIYLKKVEKGASATAHG